MDEQCTNAQWGQSPYEVTLEFLNCFFFTIGLMAVLRLKKVQGGQVMIFYF